MKLAKLLTICAAACIAVTATLPASVYAQGHYTLAFQRQLPAWENSDMGNCIGGHVCRVWIFNEAGNPVPNVRLRTSWNVLMGATDIDGRAEIPINMGDDFDLLCEDGTAASSETALLMTSDRPDCWGHYSFEVAYLYKTSIENPGAFDLDMHGTWNKPRPPTPDVDAPYTKSLAYNGVDYRNFRSDFSTWGNWQNPPSYLGQTFVATGDRVVAARVQGIIGGNDLLSWKLRIVEFPSLIPVGVETSVPLRWPFGWEAFWAVNDCPVKPGRTYMLQIWRDPGGMNIYHVTGNVYPQGQFYEGTQPFADRDLNGHVVCMTYGGTTSPDLNADGTVNFKDLSKLIKPWDTANRSMDLAPAPAGDGRIDAADIAALAECWLDYPLAAANWKLDESSGTIAADSIADKHATVHGSPTWLPADRAIRLDGIDDSLSAPFILDPAVTSFSIFAWIKTATPDATIISQAPGTGFATRWLTVEPSTGCLATYLHPDARFAQPLISSAVITDNKWHRVGLLWDVSSRSLYVDDKIVKADAAPLNNISPANGPIHFGADHNLTPSSHLHALIKDIVIFTPPLAP